MKRVIFIAISVMLLTGCGDRVWPAMYCDNEANIDRASFMLECIGRANPQSDEEPEDWIAQCERTSLRAFCSPGYKWTNSSGVRITAALSCESASDDKEKRACGL